MWAGHRRSGAARLMIMPLDRAKDRVEFAPLISALGRLAEARALSFSVSCSVPLDANTTENVRAPGTEMAGRPGIAARQHTVAG